MDFIDVAQFFDDDPVYDGYTDALLFYCHTTPHDDQTSSGATSRRRTMTTIDGTTAPARGVVKVFAERWLVSGSNPDGFQGDNIRRSYSLKKSTGLMARLTPAEACLASAGTSFYAHKEYFRDNANARTESEWDVMWNIFIAPAEPVVKGTFLRQDSVLYRARTVYPTVDGYQIAEADQFDADAAQSVTFTTAGVLNLVTDTMTATSQAVSAIQTDVQKFYEFRTQAESTQQPGDRTVFVPKASITPKVGSQFTMLTESWRVLAVVSELDTWAVHARRV